MEIFFHNCISLYFFFSFSSSFNLTTHLLVKWKQGQDISIQSLRRRKCLRFSQQTNVHKLSSRLISWAYEDLLWLLNIDGAKPNWHHQEWEANCWYQDLSFKCTSHIKRSRSTNLSLELLYIFISFLFCSGAAILFECLMILYNFKQIKG